YEDIQPLPNFNWKETEPLQLRPFKPKYHLTMGKFPLSKNLTPLIPAALENISISELLEIDNTYLTRLHLRRSLISQHSFHTIAANPRIAPAITEFYTWIFGTYLPRRFPTIYVLHPSTLLNTATNEYIPLVPANAIAALEILAAHVDTDFLFLLPDEEGKYKLEGFATCFPSGFDTRRKLGLSLADIHAPVPGYKARLEKSMDRFFASLAVGRVVRRGNWSVATRTELFRLEGSHLYEDDVGGEGGEGEAGNGEMEEIDFEQTIVRCERQTLHRLPRTGALVFAFKTYAYPIRKIREEGSGKVLAMAIDGLGEGNVPGMKVYKRGVVWGERVKEFLLS
ncbi:hypothetical protein M501DRAFT_925378, partial [Patellaria atrata CBS 101060]